MIKSKQKLTRNLS